MASGLEPRKSTPEEIIQRQGGASKKAKAGQQVRVVGGQTGSGLYNPQHSGLNTQTLIPDADGIIRADNGAYKWDERLQRYSAIPGQGRGYLLVDPVQQAAAATSGGGGGNKSQGIIPSAQAPQPQLVYDEKFNAPLTTDQILGETKQQMLDWRPTASNGQGGVQTMNPLADPNKWMYQGLGPAARNMTLIPI